MTSQKVTKTTFTHKDKKPRRKLVRANLYQNGKWVDLKRLAARRTLSVRR